MSNKNKTIEIKHYKRTSSISKDKELVTEKVQVGSATFLFLERMEIRRKKQECLLTVDMRGKVPDDCKRYVHKNKTFWLDDTSYKIYVDGMKQNNLVFTVGTFEEIINGKHTYKAMRMAGMQTQKKTGGQGGGTTLEDTGTSNPYLVLENQPEIIPLGYYRKRKEERLQHITDVLLSNDGYSIELKTRDISPKGILVVSRQFIPFEPGDTVTVAFTGFNQDENANLAEVEYEILNIISTDEEYRASLRQKSDGETGASRFIASFIDNQLDSTRGRRKLDHEDARLTAYSQILELYYTLSTPVIPFFLSQEEDDCTRISVICKNPNNAVLLNMLKDENQAYDFTDLVEENRVKGLVAMAQEDGQKDPILAIYHHRDTGNPRVVCDFEFPLASSWLSFVRDYANDEQFRIYKVLLRPVSNKNPQKIDTKLLKLRSKSDQLGDEVLDKISKIVASGALVEVTSQIVHQAKHAKFLLDDDAIRAGRNIVEMQTTNPVNVLPEILSFGYVEQRKEDRYQASVTAEITIRDQQFEASTRDISIHGLCVEIDQSGKSIQGISKNSKVGVSLPGLNKKAKQGINLIDIPYEITCVERSGKILLHLKRIINQDARGYTDFFKDLIDRNMGKLSLDLHDVITAAYSRIYSSLAAESTATIPVLIRRDEERKNEISVALPEMPSPFSEFFETRPGEFDFSSLNVSSRLSRLTAGLRKNNCSEILVYLYKIYNPGSQKFEIYSAADFEFKDSGEKTTFLEDAMQQDFCVVKVLAGTVQQPPGTEINSIIDPLFDRASHIATRLKSEIANIVAIGEIVDVTRQELENQTACED